MKRRLGLALLLLVATLGCSPGGEDKIAAPAVVFDAVDMAGRPVALAALRGNTVLLNSWATWCKPCREEIPFLAELQSRDGARGLRVVGVNVDAAADHAEVPVAVQRLGVNYTVWLDPDARVETLMGTNAVPASVLIDRGGRIMWRHVGILRQDTPGFAEALAVALEQ